MKASHKTNSWLFHPNCTAKLLIVEVSTEQSKIRGGWPMKQLIHLKWLTRVSKTSLKIVRFQFIYLSISLQYGCCSSHWVPIRECPLSDLQNSSEELGRCKYTFIPVTIMSLADIEGFPICSICLSIVSPDCSLLLQFSPCVYQVWEVQAPHPKQWTNWVSGRWVPFCGIVSKLIDSRSKSLAVIFTGINPALPL